MARLFALLLLGFTGCSSRGFHGAAPVDGGGDGGGGRDAGIGTLVFSPCPLLTEPGKVPPSGPLTIGDAFDGRPSPIGQLLASSNGLDAASSAMAECATAKMPVSWSHPEGDSIDVFVKRYPAAMQPARGQLWMLGGGPGDPGSILETLAFLIATTLPTLDLYLPDHRGTGKSTFAACSSTSTPAECAAAVPHLRGLTATDAARDLAALIDASRTSSQQVFVYASSYGTYWAQRYLQIRPDQPTAIVLDSTIPIGDDWSTTDKTFDDTAHAVLSLCQADTTCSAKLGPDPVAKAEQALVAVDTGKCHLPAGKDLIRGNLGDLVGAAYFDRLLLPATIYRTLRCNDADRAWFEKVAAYREWWNGLHSVGYSNVVDENIVLSELWPTNPTYATLLAQEQTMIAIDGGPPSYAYDLVEGWPKYPRDAYHGKWPSSPAATLVMQGTLDPSTPHGDVVKRHYSGQNQYYVEVPLGGQGLTWPLGSPMTDLTAPSCGWQVVQSFLADPTVPPDTSCIAAMAPLDFGNPPMEYMAVAGIQDLWENP